ncbi:MAG: APC family permease [Micrococcales bacterium]
MASTNRQQLNLAGAIAIGMASMLGAGVFVVFRDAYAITPGGLFLAITLAAIVASLNAGAVYSLASQIERPGGVYAYSRIYVNEHFSFSAGFAFVFGKIGSIAAIALAFQEYVWRGSPIWLPMAAIAVLTVINILGINRTAAVAAVLATATTGYLLFVTIGGALNNQYATAPHLVAGLSANLDLPHILQAASVVFFAFAGYARVATLGNEVRDAKRNIPRAILVTLTAVVVLYFALAVVLIGHLGASLAVIPGPLDALAQKVAPWLPSQITPLVAGAASLGSILALLAGVSRTAAVMAEDRELPKVFMRRNRLGSPWVSEVLIAAGAMGLVSIGKLSWVIGFSSFSVLFYYSVGHLSLWFQPAQERKLPRWLAIPGFLLCWALAFAVPGPAVPISLSILALALLARYLVRRANPPKAS